MSFLRQTALLTQKDLLVIWRSKARFLAEMLVALLILPLILIIVTRATEEIHEGRGFDPVQITGNSEDIERNVKQISRISIYFCNKNISLAYSSSPDIEPTVDRLMDKLKHRYANARQKGIIEPERFASADLVRDTMLQDLNRTYSQPCSNYLGGFHFTKLNPSTGEMEYKVFMQNRQQSQWTLDEFWPDDGAYAAVADQNDIPGFPQYWQSGFLSVQFAIDDVFLSWRNATRNYTFMMQRMPTPKIRSSSVVAFLKQTPFFWMVMVMLVMMFTVKNIVAEKEAGIKAYMMVMGLNPYAFYASHFVVAFLKIFIVVSLCSALIAFTFGNISASLFVAFSITYGIAAVSFAVFISVIVTTSPGLIVVFAWLGLGVIDYFLSPSPTDIAFCFFASLNPYTAFKLGVKAATNYEMRLMDLGWFNMFDESSHSFSFGLAFLMLKFDIVILLVLICYIDAVAPNDGSPRRHPLFFLDWIRKRGPRRRPCVIDEDETDGVVDDNTESDSGMNRDEADIDIRKLVKIWETTGQVAVDSLSLRAYRGQVTVLLGHNGAGKSTTFSVIAGSTSPSCGNILICKEDIVENLRECQRNIGYCPQYNPLFEKLTAREHLRLYAKLKTGKDQRNVEDDLSSQLSGGMKRKLCVGMSLIGNSRVILLDEPTAGMDPGARHDIRVLLERAKRDRTILLTTHYMDEADLLGDRIAIMVKGRIVCNGSPTFLKNKFGTGYVLSVVVSTNPNPMDKIDSFDAKIDRILRVVRKHAPDARVDKTSHPQFSLILPTQYKKYFASLFYELEQRKEELSVDSFGLSFNTLEQVFLRVGELADPTEDEVDAGGEITGRAAAMRHEADSVSVPVLLARQVLALLYRHWLNALRNRWRTLLPVLLSVFIFAAFAGSVKYQTRQKIERREFNLATIDPVSVPLQLIGSGGGGMPGPDFPYIVNKMRTTDSVRIPENADLQRTLVRLAYRSPPLGIGAAVNTAAGNNTIVALFNGAAHHVPPMALLLLSNAFVKNQPDSVKFSIELVNMPFSETTMAMVLALVSTMAVSIIVILAFSSLTSTFAMVLVEDRESHFKNQLLFTRLHIGVYWLAVTLWFLLFYAIFCLLIAGVFFAFGWLQSCMGQTIVLWALYFWCCIPFVYCFSFMFDSPIKAFTAFLAWNVVVSLVAVITVAGLSFANATLRDILATVFYLFLPSFSLGDGMVRLAMQCAIPAGAGGMPPSDGASVRVEVCMLLSGAFFWILLAVLESKTIAVLVHRIQCRIRHRNYQTIEPTGELLEDEDVIRERRAVMEHDDSEYALSVREVYKYYGNFSAVRNLTFGVRQTDCFGLLGVNGAGKTTTFNMLTGLSLPSSGRATISGVDVTGHPSLSYCPQFDALALDLTGRETLMILARLNGFKDAASRVENVLWCIHLTSQANKLVKYYSGGQRRRLSIGVTLISRSSLIMLDEPTAGIDPKTRRYIWNLLTALRSQNVAMLLTSHSMDECEALCNNIGFMNKGTLVSIGTSQHLKSRYGNSFLLTYTVANPSKEVTQVLNTVVTREFSAEPTQDAETSTTLNWDIPRRSNDTWSDLYRRAQEIADRYPVTALPPTENIPRIKDFSLTQNSLEQVFLRLTKLSTGSEVV